MEYTIHIAEEQDLSAIKELLKQSHLPAENIDSFIQDILVMKNAEGQLIGSAGFEVFNDAALFRSFSILESYRGQQLGQKLFDAAIIYARNKNIKELYLLTETAPGFFIKNDFKRISRNAAPVLIQQTAEFSGGCSKSAIAMYKQIEHLK